MNPIDLLLAAIVAAGIWGGWRRGLLGAGADLLALAGSVAFALAVLQPGVAILEHHRLTWQPWTAPLVFVTAGLAARVALGLVFARLSAALPPVVHGHALNRALGTLPGAGNGLINALLASILLLTLPLPETVTQRVGASQVAAQLSGPADWLQARIEPIFAPALDRTLSRMTVRPGSGETLSLPYKVAQPKPRPDLEAAMLVLVNRSRGEQGLRPLQPDPEVLPVARAHSRDMFARGYFSHVTPEGAGPFDRLRRSGVRFRTAGENLALARTLAMAHQGLLDSPGHRANIMQPAFGRVGIGILDGGRYGLMVTQNFRN